MPDIAVPVPSVDAFLALGPVIPVAVIDDADRAVPLARALLAGGVRVIEITLRTAAGLGAIERVVAEVPEIKVGAGTVTTAAEARAAVSAGAEFLVLPGSPRALLDAALLTGVPVLPAATSPTEVMELQAHGLTSAKFFPAAAAGGPAFLAALAGPFPDVRWCPTGGITPATAVDYLALPNVTCIGASWLTPRDHIAVLDWDAVTKLAHAASSLES